MVISTDSLGKCYGSFTALDDCTLKVVEGEVFGLLGPNGSGKTTLLRLLLGFLRPTHGRAAIEGLDCYRQSVAVRSRLSYLPAETRLFRRMRGRDVLKFFANVRPDGSLKQAMRVARELDLDVQRRVALMSTGMRQKLALAIALSPDARLLVLDEPTANLDPNVRRIVMDLIRKASGEGRTVLLSSHVLSEMEELSDRVVILRRGRLVHTQVMQQLRQRHRIMGRSTGTVPAVSADLAGRVTIRQIQDQIVIETCGDLSELLGWLAELPLADLSIERSGLRSVYDQFHSGKVAP